MKTGIYTGIFLLLFCTTAWSQCTNGGLRVQSSTCEAPQNLTVLSVNCQEVKVSWAGGKSQAYILKATLLDSAKGTITTDERQVTTDETGKGEATIKAKQGVQVHWSVQAICNRESYKMYSKEVTGGDTLVPLCVVTAETTPVKKLTAYPNPAKNYLMVGYQASADGRAVLEVYNMEGKKMLSKTEAAVAGQNNNYKLNIMGLPPGNFLLKVTSAKEGISEVKFVKAER